MKPGFSSLRGLIAEGLRRYHLEAGVKAARAVEVWAEVAGSGVASQTQADIVRDGVLWVYTRSSTWSQELAMLREHLVSGINAAVGGEVIHDIRFRVRHLAAVRPSSPAAAPPPPRHLTEADRRLIADLAERLEEEAALRIGKVAEKGLTRGDRNCVCPKCGGPMKSGHRMCPFCR